MASSQLFYDFLSGGGARLCTVRSTAGAGAYTSGTFGLSMTNYKAILGGTCHTNCGRNATILQGGCNIISNADSASFYQFIGNGGDNQILSLGGAFPFRRASTILDGEHNLVGLSGSFATANGFCNQALGVASHVMGGGFNVATNNSSTILMGQVVRVNGCYSTESGNRNTLALRLQQF